MKNNFFVFDTSVLLSALFDAKSIPAEALKKARTSGALLISDETAAEYLQVFAREKFDKYVPSFYRFAFIENIIANALPVVIQTQIIACRDARDNKFLSLAVNGMAGYIISGDKDLLELHPFRDIPVLKPIDFLNHF
jgi:putative PIN family toxin of toxin-antitoxin system